MEKKYEQLEITDAFIFSKVMNNYKLARRLVEKLMGKYIKNIVCPKNNIVVYSDGKKGISLEVKGFDEGNEVWNVRIFLCKEDIFGAGKSVYRFEEQCTDVPELILENGRKQIFVCAIPQTAEKEENEDIKAFLYYLMNSSDKRNNFARMLDDEVRRVRANVTYKKEYRNLLQAETEMNQRIYAESRRSGNKR